MDIKPSNIMIDTHAVIIDLGLAMKADDKIPFVGSRYFRAPEVHVGTSRLVDKSIDYWSLGMLIYCHWRKPFACNGKTNVNASWCKLLGHEVSGVDDELVYEKLLLLEEEFNNHIDHVCKQISGEYLRNLLKNCLRLNPKDRKLNLSIN